jgi:hypothetical protein
VLARTTHRRVPTPRFRSVARNRKRIAKLHPISLGLPLGAADRLVASPPAREKTIDAFFAGRIGDSSTVRQRGFDELLTLREEGYDVADAALPFEEYLARCARAHLVWSPGGFGWQTFRICEAAICGAAPLVSRPSNPLRTKANSQIASDGRNDIVLCTGNTHAGTPNCPPVGKPDDRSPADGGRRMGANLRHHARMPRRPTRG